MEFSESFAQTSTATSPRPGPSKPSGLTLVLPALKGGKPIKLGKKTNAFEEEKKAPRPVKLKPLKEVLSKLIVQIKKKDDYAFFLKPVDATQVPGYSDVVKRPMDLGTMTTKVERGKYRSLDDFAADLKLVASNAKAFNPPESIYYTEAERIEAWGLDHIVKAAATVIQYETDWNIEIENDDESTPVVIDDDGDYSIGTPMDIDDPSIVRRSPSVSSQVQPGTTRRAARGPYKKTTSQAPSSKVAETVDSEGRLPGSRDGLAAFPSGSDWARTLLALKLKGKRYKTKKERLRFEKEGPPIHADGSLDYTEMEDPFSVLSALVPDPETRPYLTQLHPPSFTAPSQYDPSSSSSSTPRPTTPYFASINLHYQRTEPQFSIPTVYSGKRRHWTIVRNPTRSKQKDREEEAETPEVPAWQTPREIQTTDYGSYARLTGALEEELHQRKISGREGEEAEKVIQVLRDTLDGTSKSEPAPVNVTTGYWTSSRAAAAEEYIRDVVYGGVDGLAYVRSLAEFVEDTTYCASLGMSLVDWVQRTIIDPLTDGRHSLLRETAFELARQKIPSVPHPHPHPHPPHPHPHHSDPPIRNNDNSISKQVDSSLHVYPVAAAALFLLMQIETQKIDMGALIKTPEELFQSEDEWAGKVFRERRKAKATGGGGRKDGDEVSPSGVNDAGKGKGTGTGTGDVEMEEPEKTWMDVDASKTNPNGEDVDFALEGPEELKEVIDYVAGVIIEFDKKIKAGPTRTQNSKEQSDPVKVEGAEEAVETKEDPLLRNLRLNLLALAKRAPLDTISRLPKELVPEHIRHFVPTLSGTA